MVPGWRACTRWRWTRPGGDGGLPRSKFNINYIIAKEDYYFVYPTNYNKYLSYYRDSFQHGGISLEEMVLPIVRLDPK